MQKEAQPLSFKEVKQGSDKDYSISRKLTPEALQQIQKYLGKPAEVTSVEERWIYEGEDEAEDHSISDTFVTGILTKIDERTIGIQVSSGKTQHCDGSSTQHTETYMEFPFYSDGVAFRRTAGNSHISSFTVDGQTFELRNAGDEKETEENERMRPILEISPEALKQNREQGPFLYVNKADLTDPAIREVIKIFQQNRKKQQENNALADSDILYSKPEPSPFKEIKQGSPEDYLVYRTVTPDLFQHIQSQLGKEVHVSFENERWVQSDDEERTKSKTYVRGTLTHVDERSIEVGDINYGWTEYDTGEPINCIGKKMVFPFHKEQFKLRVSSEISHMSTLTLRDRSFRWEHDLLKPIKRYGILFDNGDDMQASHGELVNVPEGEDPWEYARNYLRNHISPGPNGILLEDVVRLKSGEKFRNF
jgi:hypothetical protein